MRTCSNSKFAVLLRVISFRQLTQVLKIKMVKTVVELLGLSDVVYKKRIVEGICAARHNVLPEYLSLGFSPVYVVKIVP